MFGAKVLLFDIKCKFFRFFCQKTLYFFIFIDPNGYSRGCSRVETIGWRRMMSVADMRSRIINAFGKLLRTRSISIIASSCVVQLPTATLK